MSDRPDRRRRPPFRPGTKLSSTGFAGLAAAVFAGLLAAWWLVTAAGAVTPLFLPSPSRVAARLAALAASGQLWSDTLVSVYRIVVGFLLATAMAVPLGVLIGRYRFWEALIEPVIDFNPLHAGRGLRAADHLVDRHR